MRNLVLTWRNSQMWVLSTKLMLVALPPLVQLASVRLAWWGRC